MGGQLGRHLPLHLLDDVVGVGRSQVGKHSGHPLQQNAGPFHGDDGVLEGGLFRIPRNRVDFSPLLGHTSLQSGRKVLVPYPVEGRHSVGEGTLCEERVLICGHGG
jgi:hypothetical protein